MAMFHVTLSTFTLVNSLNYSMYVCIYERDKNTRISRGSYIYSGNEHHMKFCVKPNPASWLSNKFVTFSLLEIASIEARKDLLKLIFKLFKNCSLILVHTKIYNYLKIFDIYMKNLSVYKD